MLCTYGCGQEAKYYSKRSKTWRCSSFHSQCPAVRKKNSISQLGRMCWSKGLTKETNKSLKMMSDSLKGRLVWNRGKDNCWSDETLNKIRNSSKKQTNRRGMFEKGHYPWNKNLRKTDNKILQEAAKKISLKNKGRIQSLEERNKRRKPIHTIEFKEERRKKCLDGHSIYMNKCIKNPSKPEVKLREMVKELYPSCEFQYQVLNYALDIAIPEYKIAIEYDGWYHFDTEDHKKYHSKRQKEIEDCGWKFIRYNIFELFPSIEKLKEDIYLYLESEVYK